MNMLPKKGDLAKERILKEFKNLYNLNGFEKTTISNLSKACGMSQGHITFHFNKKEDIALQYLKDYSSCLFEAIEEVCALPDDPLLKIYFTIVFYAYLAYHDKTDNILIIDISQNSPLLDNVIDWSKLSFERALKRLFIPYDDRELWCACNCSVSGFMLMIRRELQSNHGLDNIRVFNLYCSLLKSQINIPDMDAYRQWSIAIFEDLSKELLVSRFRELVDNLYADQ